MHEKCTLIRSSAPGKMDTIQSVQFSTHFRDWEFPIKLSSGTLIDDT